ncbi:Bro [Apocheima cinerarium nucleopolyhedrovirus]|uniref:Bro n=1 Tax=Apocheima cinerarium nucleopolyhedrovirus TaxID=307461 RepID=UPI0001D9205A|nr:Bro [Apocheima cinerarium nucleopolyhedrovirus]ADB84398.1 Bro [Apocheima cinerarium nucleopolyhedrovirus]
MFMSKIKFADKIVNSIHSKTHGEDWMVANTKVNFVDGPLEVFAVQDEKRENWMVANPFAEALKYSKPNKAVLEKVSAQNQKTLEEINPYRSGTTDESSILPRNIQAKTKFINQAGVFELINASNMPNAKRFKAWNNNDLLPTLCQEGEYSMVKNASVDMAQGMNAVHAATNNGKEAPWIKDLTQLKQIIQKKDEIIEIKQKENVNLTTALQNSNEKLIAFANALVTANDGLVRANVMIDEARKETNKLANRIADIGQDVIVKPLDSRLLHSLAVCCVGGDQYVFLRPQKRSLKRSLNRLYVNDNDIVYKSDYVPNAINVLNKVKENLPKDKFTARHNRITLLENLTRDDLVEAINTSLPQRQVAIVTCNENFSNSKM